VSEMFARLNLSVDIFCSVVPECFSFFFWVSSVEYIGWANSSLKTGRREDRKEGKREKEKER
jgi:hypothetical protein